ncbi:MAG: adenylosuccinate lyase [Acholeplasmataceae bacterium]|nr:adenylosuccinate lyase [Acholeplasmataceae bacterium]
MIERYTPAVMKRLWSDGYRFNQFLFVEKTVSKAFFEQGAISEREYQDVMSASVTPKRIKTIEKRTHHDVISFIEAATESLHEGARVFHYGLTSTDVVDTAQALILKAVNNVIRQDIVKLKQILKKRAYETRDLPAMGRTHGIHAEVTSFGLKFALWYADLSRIEEGFEHAANLVETGKISGAVGNYAAISPEIEAMALSTLGLHQPLISTQTLQRDRHAQYISSLALIGSELDKMASDIRHLSRTEIGEVMEAFSSGQKGSSAMPHKRNPISSESICGLARVLRGYVLTAFENIALWHERDLTHSSAERIILRDASTLIVFMLRRMTSIIEHLVLFPEIITTNIEKTYGAVFAQSVLNALINKGMDRREAYDIVQKTAFEALQTKTHLRVILEGDTRLQPLLDHQTLDHIFSLTDRLTHVPTIFKRVFE